MPTSVPPAGTRATRCCSEDEFRKDCPVVLQATDLHWLTVAESLAAFKAREVSPVELTRHLLERSERLQDVFYSFVTLTPEIALAQARGAEAAYLRGEATAPLLGVPV